VSPRDDAARVRRAPAVLVPWLVYIGVTLVGPAGNGAWRDAGFAEHAGITLAVSGAIAAVWVGIGRRYSSPPARLLRRSMNTTSRHLPRCSPIRSRTPSTRKPQAS